MPFAPPLRGSGTAKTTCNFTPRERSSFEDDGKSHADLEEFKEITCVSTPPKNWGAVPIDYRDGYPPEFFGALEGPADPTSQGEFFALPPSFSPRRHKRASLPQMASNGRSKGLCMRPQRQVTHPVFASSLRSLAFGNPLRRFVNRETVM